MSIKDVGYQGFTRNVSTLFRFMLAFNIDRFMLTSVNEHEVRAIIGWPDDGRSDYDSDEETQEICWEIQQLANLEGALSIIELLIDNNLLRGDRINIPREELRQKSIMGSLFDESINDLLKIKVYMVDDGRKTDFFFLHF